MSFEQSTGYVLPECIKMLRLGSLTIHPITSDTLADRGCWPHGVTSIRRMSCRFQPPDRLGRHVPQPGCGADQDCRAEGAEGLDVESEAEKIERAVATGT